MGMLDGVIRVFGGRAQTQDETPAHPMTAAVLVAAGASTRMGEPKQLIPLLGIPVIARSLIALETAALVDEIVLVAREEDMLQLYDMAKYYEITKLTKILPGGSSRQQSVARGVSNVRNSTQFLAIHDGARPLIKPDIADEVIRAAYRTSAAAAAVRVKDTVKQTDEHGFIVATPDRRCLWNVQTPQVFEYGLYMEALRLACAQGREYTDDCQLVEQLGRQVLLCESDYANIKITTPEDVAFAEGILRRRIGGD